MGKTKSLKLGHWNVNGIGSKLQDPDFMSEIDDYDICILTETWTTESISVEGFIVHSRDAVKCKGVKSGRSSGGVIVLIKENLRKYVKVIKLAPKYGVWVKIDRTHINSDKHLFIG